MLGICLYQQPPGFSATRKHKQSDVLSSIRLWGRRKTFVHVIELSDVFILFRHFGIHQEAPEFVEMSVEQEILETGIKVVDLLAPYAKGGKIGKCVCSLMMHIVISVNILILVRLSVTSKFPFWTS